MPDHRLELLGRGASGIVEVDLVMEALVGEILDIALLLGEIAHGFDGRRLAVIRPDMQALNAQSLLNIEQLHHREIPLLLGGGLRDGPFKLLARHELGHADGGYPVEVLLARIIHAQNAVLPPKTLKRRHDEAK